jgi:hypothetical protein
MQKIRAPKKWTKANRPAGAAAAFGTAAGLGIATGGIGRVTVGAVIGAAVGSGQSATLDKAGGYTVGKAMRFFKAGWELVKGTKGVHRHEVGNVLVDYAIRYIWSGQQQTTDTLGFRAYMTLSELWGDAKLRCVLGPCDASDALKGLVFDYLKAE